MLHRLLTPESLQGHGFFYPDQSNRQATALVRVFDATDEDISDTVLDTLVTASGRWLDEEALIGGELIVTFDTLTGRLDWEFATADPELQGLSGGYSSEREMANAVRFLAALTGTDFGLAVARIGCSYAVENGQLLIDSKPVALEWPATDHAIQVAKGDDAVVLEYVDQGGSLASADLLSVIGKWA